MQIYIKEAAKRIGVSIITLKRWFANGKVREVARNRNGWRIFTEEDIERIKAYAEQRHYPEEENERQSRLF